MATKKKVKVPDLQTGSYKDLEVDEGRIAQGESSDLLVKWYASDGKPMNQPVLVDEVINKDYPGLLSSREMPSILLAILKELVLSRMWRER